MIGGVGLMSEGFYACHFLCHRPIYVTANPLSRQETLESKSSSGSGCSWQSERPGTFGFWAIGATALCCKKDNIPPALSEAPPLPETHDGTAVRFSLIVIAFQQRRYP